MSDRDFYGFGAQVDLNHLRTFLAIYRTGSFTAGARLVGLAQPTVTAQMRSLEADLGRPLFHRLPRGVAPTSVADALAARIAGPLDELSGTAGAPSRPVPPVHLAGPAELICLRALPALAPLVADGVRLRVTTGLTDELLAGARAGQFDLVISTARPTGRVLVAEPLADEEFVLVAALAWAERLGGALAEQGAAALADAPLITYAEDLPIARRYWRHVFGTRLHRTAAVVVPDLRGVLAATVAGAGITVLPRYLCEERLADGGLVALLEPDDPPINTGFLVRLAGAEQSPHARRVREALLAAARMW